MKRNLMLLAFALLLNVMFFSTDVNAEGSVTSQADVLSVWGNEAPIQEKQLFSGWYIDQNYDKPITSKSQIPAGGAYAKFVDEKVLSVNLQVKENTNGRFDMRLISSVDTLNYKKIGFDIYYNGKTTPVTYESEFVFERIQASVDGVTYNYSPQVVDVDSEYFVTVTIKNIHPNNLNKIFYIQPYWKTFDGVKVYGVSRYLTVEQGTAVGNINMPVKMDDPATDTIEIKVGSTTVTANVAYYDSVCGYAHLNIPVEDKTALKSATTIMDSANNRLAVYRNLETTYNGTADNTWYTEYRKSSGNTETKYAIATRTDLYGFAALINESSVDFSSMTFYLIADIQANDGDTSVWTADNAATYSWTPIGQNKVFKGTFDGNGHTISGIYMNSATQYSGLFGQANANATIRDFYLKDSFFYSSAEDMGSVVGFLAGSMDCVYSSATVQTANKYCGGLCGTVSNGGGVEKVIQNCQFAGTVTYDEAKSANTFYIGGLIGRIAGTGIKKLNNCLMTGTCKVNSYSSTNTSSPRTGYYYVGGLVGGIDNTNQVEISNCINAGKVITATNTAGMGTIIGSFGSSVAGNITISTSYAVDISENMQYTGTESKVFASTANPNYAKGYGGTNGSTATINTDTYEAILSGNYAGYDGMDLALDINDTWVLQKDTTPALRKFVKSGLVVPDVTWETDANGAYLISSIEELAGLAYKSQKQNYPGKTFKLTQDIALNQKEMSSWNNDYSFKYEWLPIGNATYAFASTFDGDSHTISGIYMNSDTQYSGLFATTNASSMIRDFYLTDSYFYTSKGDMGSIVGKMSGSMEGVYSSAIVETISKRCGGLCGTIGGGTEQRIKNSQFAGTVSYSNNTGTNGLYLGGVVGQIDSTGTKTIENCLMTGSCTVSSYKTTGESMTGYYRVGGILGGMETAGTGNVLDCVVRGKITATNTAAVGAIVGIGAGTSTLNITDCYMVDIADNMVYTGDQASATFPNIVSNGGYGFKGSTATITSDFKPIADEDYLGYDGSKLNLDTTGWVLQKDAMPELRNFVTIGLYTPDVDWATDSEGAYLIGSMAELAGLAYKSQTQNYAGKTFKMTADLVLNEGTVDTWNNEDTFKYEWIPIGNGNKAFASTFNGADQTISGIYMNSDARYSGLFGAGNANATLCNFSLKDSYFYTSAEDMGSVVGSLNGSMENVYSSAIVESSSYRLGGLCGIIAGGQSEQHITNCWFDGSLIADGSQISTDSKEVGFGGIVGTVKNAGAKTIDNCLSSASVQITKGQSINSFGIGGIAGVVYSNSSNVNLTISNCVSACEFTVDDSTSAGSVIGIMYDNAAGAAVNTVSLTNAYSTEQSIETVSTGVGLKFAQATLNGRTIEVSADDYLIGYAGYDKSELLDFENTWTLRKDNIPALKQFVPETEQMTAIEEFLAIATLGTGITLRGNGVDAGDGSYVITVDDTTGSIYTDYIAALGNKGFIEYANNNDGLAAAGVQNVIYTKVDGETTWVVTVTHAGNDKQKTYVAIRTNEALSPHLDGAVSYTNENGYTTTGLTPTVTMLQIQKAESSGQSFVIQLSNGHFIVYDGGFEVDLEYLITYMKGLSDGQKPIVEAWVVSHAHQDHAGVFAKVYTDARDGIAKWADEIYVEGIYYNESAAYVKGNFTPVESGESLIYDVMDLTWYEKVQRGMNLLKTTIDDTTPIYRYRTGQRFTFADVTMDVVQMEENLFDVLVSNGMYNDGSNATSTTVLFTINDKKVYLGGDERLSNMNFMQAAYNASHFYGIDVYVAPHHGANTSPSFNKWCTDYVTIYGDYGYSNKKFGMTLFPCYGETPVYWQGDTVSEKNYELITEYTKDQTIYTYANGNVVLTIGETISVSR